METLFNVTDRRIEKKGNRNPFLGGLSKWVSYNSRMSMRKGEGVKGMFTLPPQTNFGESQHPQILFKCIRLPPSKKYF